MSFRNTNSSFESLLQELVDFKQSVEDGDYLAGSLTLDVPLQIGNLIFDTPRDPDTGQTLLTVTNAQSGTTVQLLSVP